MFKGDIVLIPFPFTNLTGSKLRHAAVLAANKIDVTVCFITRQIGWQEPTDMLLGPNLINGLKITSLVRASKIATLDRALAKGLLGKMSATELTDLNYKSKALLQLL